MELVFANCIKEIPTAAAKKINNKIKGLHPLVKIIVIYVRIAAAPTHNTKQNTVYSRKYR